MVNHNNNILICTLSQRVPRPTHAIQRLRGIPAVPAVRLPEGLSLPSQVSTKIKKKRNDRNAQYITPESEVSIGNLTYTGFL